MREPIPISTLDDPRVEVFRDLRDKDLRGHGGLFMAESEMVLRRILECPDRLHALLLTPPRLAALRGALDVVPDSVPVYVAELDIITQIAGFYVHRGVLAACKRSSDEALTLEALRVRVEDRVGLTVLVTEGVTNVDNMGGLFRNAAAFGVDAVVLDPSSCDPLYRKAVRVSMGHVLSVPYAVSETWPADLDRLRRDWRLTVIGAEVGPGAIPLWQLPRVDRAAFVFGTERHGLSDGALAACDVVCQIPMAGVVPSLNVATASAVVLYEHRRAVANRA